MPVYGGAGNDGGRRMTRSPAPRRTPRIAVADGRSVAEWIGSSPDAKVPDQVRLRILLRYDRTCYLSGRPIRPSDKWELEHIKALSLGGEHRESNLAPALVEPHKVKTRSDRKVKAKSDHTIAANYGIRKAKRPLSHARLRKRMDGSIVDRETGAIIRPAYVPDRKVNAHD